MIAMQNQNRPFHLMTDIHGCHILRPCSNLAHAIPLLVENSCNPNMQHKTNRQATLSSFSARQISIQGLLHCGALHCVHSATGATYVQQVT